MIARAAVRVCVDNDGDIGQVMYVCAELVISYDYVMITVSV